MRVALYVIVVSCSFIDVFMRVSELKVLLLCYLDTGSHYNDS